MCYNVLTMPQDIDRLDHGSGSVTNITSSLAGIGNDDIWSGFEMILKPFSNSLLPTRSLLQILI
jgi:hypothetical protein